MNSNQFWGLAISVAALILLMAGIFLYKRAKATNDKKSGPKKTSKILKRTALLHGYKVLNNLRLPFEGGFQTIDHIFIGYFGILVVTSKIYGGEIFAVPDQKEWTQVSNEQKTAFYNPLYENRSQIQALRKALNDLHLYKIPIEGIVVFCGKKLILNIPKGHPVLSIGELGKYIDQEKFYKDKDVDVDRLYEKLRTYQLAQDHLPH